MIVMRGIPGFSKYGVTENGEIYSFKFSGMIKLKRWFDKNGYIYYKMTDDMGKRKNMAEHRIVYMSFHGDLVEGMDIDHLDSNPSNNHYSNLEQVTHVENLRRKRPVKAHNRKLSRGDIERIFTLRREGMSQERIAREIGAWQKTISHILNGKAYRDFTPGQFK